MKLRFLYFLFICGFLLTTLQSKRLGLASQFGLDRTGSPLSGGLNCGQCHSGAINNAGISITVKNGGGTVVTSYTPGDTYSVEIDVFSNFGFARGFQSVALSAGNVQAGNFTNPGTNTKITNMSGRQYPEHSTPALAANSFIFTVDWTAPSVGTGNVTFYADGIVGNNNNATSGDDPCGPITVVLTEDAAAQISYAQDTFCANDFDPTPTITGIQGGTFSGTPAGLSINASSGTIDLSASTPGLTYEITYTFGGGTTVDSVYIAPLDDATFSYSQSSYCINDPDPTPTANSPGGMYAATPSGLALNSTTGEIDVSASTIGNYTVFYLTNGPCSTSGSVPISITNLDDASFAYGASSYCQNGTDPIPTPVVSGGTYSSAPAGLSLSSSTGQVDLSTSTVGAYTITYTTSGSCSNSSNSSFTVLANDNASFNYSASSYCVNDSDPTPTVTGLGGGTFSSSPAGLSISSSTGLIDVSASTAGAYTVTYTTNGSCPNTSNVSVTINGLDNASFNYSASSYCVNDSDPTPTVTGLGGGTFSSSPSGLSISSSTGLIDVSASTVGAYTVTYTTNGSCPNTSNVSVTINGLDNASFNYSASSYCVNDSDPTPTVTGLGGGTFSSSPSGLSISSSTGLIDVSASTAGAYTITYTTNGSCPNTSNVSVTINGLDNAGFNYSASSYCVNDSDPTPTVTGLGGGTFSSSPAGLSISSSTGLVDVSASTVGAYTVTYTTNGSCPNTSNVSVTINGLDNASFNYSASSYCVNDSDPTPTVTGLGGGTFSSSPSGLSISSSTGLIDVSASTAGAYTVTYTTNGSCPNTSNVSVTINGLDNASFNYSASSYCVNDSDPTPTVTGLGGGTFSSSPAGLSISSSTGLIDVSASTAGAYTITYTTNGSCPNTSNVSVTINGLDNAGFNYSASSYCVNDSDPTPTVTGLGGGTFSSSPSGLSISSSTGLIDVSASTAGAYTVTYTTNGSCPNTSNVSVTINGLDNASFTYGGNSYCQNQTDPSPTVSFPGGTFSSSPVGLSINSSTGQIDVSASSLGAYTVVYTTNGTCPNTSNLTINITSTDDASFTYTASSYCQNGSDPTPTITGTTGTFSSTTGLAINATTGVIDVSASTPGNYNITYTTNGPCPNSSVVALSILVTDDPSFSYSASNYCQDATDPTPTITGTTGTFSSSSGLVINSTTGEIDVSASTAGTYNVTYTTNGSCPSTSIASVTISATDNASFTYSSTSYCKNEVYPTPTASFANGTWSSTAGLSINSSTGQIDLANSTPGNYVVTHLTNGTCPSSSTANITIVATDNANFSYNSTTACQNGTDLTATVTGLAGGQFTASAGLSINPISGLIDVSASSAGNFIVTYTTNGPCPSSSILSITITANDDATFSYGGATFCQNATDPSPTTTLAGGTFSSAPVGLTMNASTGVIDVSASTPGSYNVTYTTNGPCPNSSVQAITITTTGNASFNYSAASYCTNVSDPTPTIGGNPGGTFSSTAGLIINASTGLIDVSLSTPGAYVVTYTVTGTCPSSSTENVTIILEDDANFTYSASSYCENGTDPTPTVTGLSGGQFTSTSGLSINPTSGQIDLSLSTAGTYNVTYTTNGPCPNTAMVSVTITGADNASFTYGAASFCQNGTDPTPTASFTTGTWSAPAGLSINSSTGEIDLSASTAGSYIVTHTTNGACPSSSTTTITITVVDDATFTYNANSSCQNGSDLTATITGLAGGQFSSTSGLVVDPTSGLIDVSASTAGTYNVTYTTNGACPNSTVVAVTITVADDASFTYGGATFCQNASDPVPTVGTAGGLFSSTPTGLNISSSTGVIDVSASSVGSFIVTYVTNGSCPDSSTLNITITATGNAAFFYDSTSYCQNVNDPTPTITGNPGGSFSSTSGLVLVPSTGKIDLAASVVGSYTITYTVSGACPSSATTVVTIQTADSADFTYTDTTICLNAGSNPILSVTGTTTGTYTVVPSGLVFANTATGEIDLAASTFGNYVLTYTSNGTCPAFADVNVDLSICGGIQTALAEVDYKLYPNPNEGSFTLESIGASGDVNIRVRDLYGRIIYLEDAYLEETEPYYLDVPNLVGGMYLVEIQKENQIKTIKMIVAE